MVVSEIQLLVVFSDGVIPFPVQYQLHSLIKMLDITINMNRYLHNDTDI